MTSKSNRKKQTSRSPVNKKLASAQALLATLTIILLSAFGLMRCLDEKSGSPLDPMENRRTIAVKRVDVGKDKTADPTLINENILLKEEAPEAHTEPVNAPPAELSIDTDTAAEETIEKQFPLFGVAFHFHTQFKAEAKNESRVIGYARRGAAFRVSDKISTEGCKSGWHEIAPGGLFACANQGIIVGTKPVSFAPSPPAPDATRSLPYRYAYITADNTPQYWRVPTDAEIAEVTTLFSRLSPVDIERSAEMPPSATATPTAANIAQDAGVADSAEATPVAETPPDYPDYLHMRMAKGYYVSLDDMVQDAVRKYQRTVRGRLIPAERTAAAKVSDFEGFLITDPAILPQVIIVGSGVTSLRQKVKDGPFENGSKVSHLERFDYLGEIKRNNKTYIQIGDGQFVSSRVAAVIRPQALPKDLLPGERWVDIDLSAQTLMAYEGERPVFATVVSTGRDRFLTPQGEFRVYAKHIAVTMDDTEAGAEAYSIEDVPWVQYFKDGYALHGAFWHDRFGRVRSHGCVNLSPKDAKRLFAWTGPEIASGIHGRFATRDNPGTRVIIHE